MPYLPHNDEDRRAMLEAIGAGSLEELFAPIPEELRLRGPLGLGPGMTESELVAHMEELGSWNRPARGRPVFLGGGVYDHGWPAVVDHLAARSEFLTAYTPYQPECSQGTLQWIFEFQSMIAELCGMEVANASMYDGASACAEAALLALGLKRRRRIVVSRGVHPQVRQTLATYLEHQEGELVEAPLVEGRSAWDGLVDGDTAAVIVQQPNFLGLVEELDPAAARAREHGALAIAVFQPVAAGLLRSPGQAGFDLVVGDGQALGVPMAFGGPSFGFFAGRQEHVRRMPGRLVGTSVDRQGRRAFTLTFQTREQHIRREKATSNICTNNSLVALRGCIHMAALGPRGIQEVACLSRQRALELRDALVALPGVHEAFPGAPFFQEVPLRLSGGPEAVRRLRLRLAEAGIAAVLPVDRWYPELPGVFTLACTERTTAEDIQRLATEAARSLGMEMAL